MNTYKLYNISKVIEFLLFLILSLSSLSMVSNTIYYSCNILLQLWTIINGIIWFLLFVFSLVGIKKKYLLISNILYFITLVIFTFVVSVGYYLSITSDNCGGLTTIIYISLIIESLILLINYICVLLYCIKIIYKKIQNKLSISNEIDNSNIDEYVDYIFSV